MPIFPFFSLTVCLKCLSIELLGQGSYFFVILVRSEFGLHSWRIGYLILV